MLGSDTSDRLEVISKKKLLSSKGRKPPVKVEKGTTYCKQVRRVTAMTHRRGLETIMTNREEARKSK